MQTRTQSAIESVANVLVGYTVSICAGWLIYPLFGLQVSVSSNLAISAWFTVISLVRSYVLRRYFNGLKFRSEA